MKSFEDIAAACLLTLGPETVGQALLEMKRRQAQSLAALDREALHALACRAPFSAPAVRPTEDRISALHRKFPTL